MGSAETPKPGRGYAGLWAAVVVLVGAFVVAPLVLHFAQKRHNQLVIDLKRVGDEQTLNGGEVFAGSLIAIVEHEISGGTGWRPNDFFLWGPGLWADNNANRQRGIIQAVRETVRVLKDHLTKVSSDQYDANLIAADNAFRNDMEKLWLPSAESKLRDGTRALKLYVAGLKTTPMTSRPINQRNIELIRLVQTYGDLLGDAHGSLYRDDIGFWQTDDVFYRAQGYAHVMHFMVQAVEQEYHFDVQQHPVMHQLLTEIADALGKAATLKPLVVCNGSPAGLLANHRRNLDAYITEARQKMYSVREELEK